jgi:NAD-specific glutamate dehydrogenase
MDSSTNIKKSLALSRLDCKIDDFSSDILEIVNAESKGELYIKFVKQFLKYIPVDYRSRDKISLFEDFTYEAFEFFVSRSLGKRNIEIHVGEFHKEPSITILDC